MADECSCAMADAAVACGRGLAATEGAGEVFAGGQVQPGASDD